MATDAISLEEFTRRWPRFSGRYVKELAVAIEHGAADYALGTAKVKTPTGTARLTKGSLSKAHGTLKRSWLVQKGRGGRKPTKVYSNAPHARIVNAPYQLHPGNSTGAIGSLKSPSGLIAPIEADVLSQMENIMAKAVRVVEVKVKL